MKLTFSQRKGLKPKTKIAQLESIDEDLRNYLWSALTYYYWKVFDREYGSRDAKAQAIKDVYALFEMIWLHFFKWPIDSLSNYPDEVITNIRIFFFNRFNWNEVYDFIEFVANYCPAKYPNETRNSDFMDFCNTVLENENSAYRFVGGEIVPITKEEEISEIEEALGHDFLSSISEHLATALKLMSDRKNPDPRNSIKESISAVESLCRSIAKKPKASLGDALEEIKKKGKIEFHHALEIALDKLYGYTSNKDGIRHSLMDLPNLEFEDAKFMLVTCSAFINYLVAKIARANIEI